MRKTFLIAKLTGLIFITMAAISACASGEIGSSPAAATSYDTGINPTITQTTLDMETVTLWVSPDLPPGITDSLVVPLSLEITADVSEADLVMAVGEGLTLTSFTYALVAPFPTLIDGVRFEDLQGVWAGTSPGPFPRKPILMSEETKEIFTQWWGKPEDGAVWTMPEGDLLNYAWGNAPMLVLLPFESLDPRWKVLQVDGISPLWKDFSPEGYALSVQISLSGADGELVEVVAAAFDDILPASLNRASDELTTVVVTGVTALVRATAWEMEKKGVTHPGEVVGDLLREADITHISNEVPFAEGCPYPDPVTDQLVFCSDPKYIELLEVIGTDVVELSGDHFLDWGSEAVYFTLDLYEERGWQYYGGGRTVEEARAPLRLEHNGNLIAFIGCNGKGGFFAPLNRGLPGAVDCDFAEMSAAIAELKIDGYTVIATFQHFEYDSTIPGDDLIREFKIVSDAGADIVSGSQAHQPHSMAFNGLSLQMYGLGNLFFDQLFMGEAKSRALIARHVIYNGRYISTEIFTVRFHDFSQPQFMDQADRNRLLSELFSASGW